MAISNNSNSNTNTNGNSSREAGTHVATPAGTSGSAAVATRGRPAEVVPMPESAHVAGAPIQDGGVCGFMSKFQVHFPQTGNDNPARRITSADHRDAHGYIWRLVLHPWGHDERGCYSVFLELANSHELLQNHQRFVRLEFTMHAWDSAYQHLAVKTRFLLHKFCDQATDFGYGRAFEHDLVMARRQTYIDPQGYVRISVRIVDVQEAFFRVAVDANLSRSITGDGGGGDFADWSQCSTAGSFKHDNLLHVIEKIAELAKVPLVSCRPWLCMPRPGGAVRPVAALLPVHLKMTIREALGDRDQYYLYLEEVDVLQEVWDRRHAVGGPLASAEARMLLMTGRAYAQLPPEVHLVFLKIDRRILAAHARGGNLTGELPLNPAEEAEFMFIGKAMAHKSDKGSELVPIARNLARLPEMVSVDVYEQLGPNEVRPFSPDTTVEQAGLAHGSILLFRGVDPRTRAWQQHPNVTLPSTSTVVLCNPTAAAAAAKAAASAAATAQAIAAPVKASIAMPSPINAVVAIGTAAGSTGIKPSPSPPHGGAEAPIVSCNGGGGDRTGNKNNNNPSENINTASNENTVVNNRNDKESLKEPDSAIVGRGEKIAGSTGQAMAPGWDKAAGTWGSGGESGSPKELMNDADYQRRATCLALYQVQDAARQRQLGEIAKSAAENPRDETVESSQSAPSITPTPTTHTANGAPTAPVATLTPKLELTSECATVGPSAPPITTMAGKPAIPSAISFLPPAPSVGTSHIAIPSTTPEVLAAVAAAAAATSEKSAPPGPMVSVTPTAALPSTTGQSSSANPTVTQANTAMNDTPLIVSNGVAPASEAVLTGSAPASNMTPPPAISANGLSVIATHGTAPPKTSAVGDALGTTSGSAAESTTPMPAAPVESNTTAVHQYESSNGNHPSASTDDMEQEEGGPTNHVSNDSSLAEKAAAATSGGGAKRGNGTVAAARPDEAAAATSASVRPLRASRSASAAADTTSSSPGLPTTVTTPGGEQRRSCRKAAAAAALQISSISAPRGGGAGSRDTAAVAPASTTNAVDEGNAAGQAGGAEAWSAADSGGGVKRHAEGQAGQAPRKIAKGGHQNLCFSVSDYDALVTRMEQMPGFSMDKMYACLRTMEAVEVAKAIAKVGPHRTEELGMLEKLVTAREKGDAEEQQNTGPTAA